MGQEQRLLKGLFKDSGEIDQPSNTWRYALNVLMNDLKGTISNESGTKVAGFIPCEDCGFSDNRDHTHGYKIIGAIEVDLNRTVLFIHDNKDKVLHPSDISNNYYPRHLIAIWNGVKGASASVKILYKPVTDPANQDGYPPFDLNFNEEYPIEGTFRIDSKEDIIVYWTDDLNTPRAFNVSRQERSLEISSEPKWLYGIDPTKTHSKHINLLSLFPSSGPIPSINANFQNANMSTIGQGGGLLTGVYYLALAYVDEDFVSTNYLTVSNPVSIVPAFSHTRPTTKKDGAVPGTQTSKSITWNIQNLNTDYKYLKAAIIRKKGDATEVFKLTDKVITGDMTLNTNDIQITFAGTEGFEPLKIEDVMVDTVGYETAKTITQMDNVLYLGNLTGSPDLGYQKYANNIKVNSHKSLIEGFDTVILSMDNLYSGFKNSQIDAIGGSSVNIDETLSYRDIDRSTYHRGYRRGEVYAFYIAFIMNDGSMSYAYHIPGREPIKPPQCWPDLYGGSYGGSATRTDYEYWSLPTGMTNPALEHQRSLHSGVKSFHFYDCSGYTTGADANATSGGRSRHMGYWHNLNESYPSTPNSEVWDRNTYTSITSGVVLNPVAGFYNTSYFQTNFGYLPSGLHGMNVRHHHMPSNSNEWARTIESEEKGAAVESTTIIATGAGIFQGNFKTQTNASNWWMSDGYSTTISCKGTGPLGAPFSVNYTLPAAAGDPIPYSDSGNKIVAIEDNTVVVANVHTWVYNDNNGCKRSHSSRIRYKVTGSSTVQTASSKKIEVRRNKWDLMSYSTSSITLMSGGSMWMDSKGDQGGTYAGGCPHKGPDCGSHERHIKYAHTSSDSYIKWNISIGAGNSDNYDVRLSQDVNVLGISMEDINIPKTYANKIQGFRIYYAKRDFANKRMLGQSVLIPMTEGASRTGVCQESVANTTAQGVDATDQLLSISTTGSEPWIAKEAWAYEPSTYILNSLATNHQNTPSTYWASTNEWIDKSGSYKYFSFYDFNMLREHHSISGATHMELLYVVNNWTWNGPSLTQDKKMLSEIEISGTTLATSGDTGLYKITERWGWDETGGGGPQNCYAKDLYSAMFAGGAYMTAQSFLGGSYTLNRLLSQKAKTYLKGDSSLLAKPLGFSGKIINTYGDSTIALALKDQVELPALYSSQDGVLGSTYFTTSLSNNPTQSLWGIPPTVGSVLMTLANPRLAQTTYTGVISTTQENEEDATSNLSYIANLCAFRTDVYSSVDNQELVYTGFQVVGTDLDNFFFEDEKYIKNYSNPAASGYGQLITNTKFGQQYRRDIIVFGSAVTLNIAGANSGVATATANINPLGVMDSVTVDNAGAGYTQYDITIQAVYLGTLVGGWLTFDVTLASGGQITSITPVYSTNTFKIETGECASECSIPGLTWLNKQGCETGACFIRSYSDIEAQDDSSVELSGTPTPITDEITCELHGYGARVEVWGGFVHYSGLTEAEYNNLSGFQSATGWKPYTWRGGGGVYTTDCGGIYGGDTFIARQGVSTGVSVLEENRDSNPTHAIHYHIVESEDNINFRHMENKDSAYFPESVASDILQSVGSTIDPNSEDGMKYDANHSSLNDVRTAVPLPVKNTDRSTYPTRTIRSTRNDASGIIDNYRIWLANQFRDLPKNRGELWKLSTFNNLIYFHMEQSLFKAAGKQTMQMGDGSDAYVGSGDIFKQEPSEIVQTKDGYGGTQSQYAALTTRYGYFFVDRKGKKVFMMKDTLLEISALGMENWFIDNMNYALIEYGATELDKVDNPIVGLGYHSTWDPFNKRIILTKRDIEPTEFFKTSFALPPAGGGQIPVGKVKWSPTLRHFIRYYVVLPPKGGGNGYQGWAKIPWYDTTYFSSGGWTISYYPDQAVWCSFHTFVPYIYFNTTETFYSVTDQFPNWQGSGDTTYPTANDFMVATGTNVGNKGIWQHNTGRRGLYYQDNLFTAVFSALKEDYWTWSSFELEVIQNTLKGFDTLTSSIAYMLDVTNDSGVRVMEHGFTSFYVYNSFQISGDETSSLLEYMINVRKIGNSWKINRFRDMSLDVLRGPTGPQVDPYYMSTNSNLTGNINVGTSTTSHFQPMFTRIGMSETVTNAYLDFTKPNLRRRKFIDKWIGIRLIYDNITNNLLNLYSTSVESRKMYR